MMWEHFYVALKTKISSFKMLLLSNIWKIKFSLHSWVYPTDKILSLKRDQWWSRFIENFLFHISLCCVNEFFYTFTRQFSPCVEHDSLCGVREELWKRSGIFVAIVDIWTEPFGQMFPTAQKQKKKKTKQTNKEKILQQLDEHVLL